MTANKKIPALRFKEFEGEWQEEKIGNCSIKVGSGSTPNGGEKVYTTSGIPFIRSQNIINNSLSLDNISCIPEEINDKMQGTIVKPLDILLNITGASIGRSCVVPTSFDRGNVNQHVCIIRLNSSHSPFFFQAYLSSTKGQNAIERSQVGSGREGLNFQSIRLLKIIVPKLSEQKKIASFLTAVDDKIQQLTKKKALLEQYKKGVMQQIFNQQIRFKDDNGNDYPDWEERSLKELLVDYRLGGNYSNSEGKTEYPLIKMGNLNRGKISIYKLEYIANTEEINPLDKIEYGDLFFNTRNTLDLVGKVAIWRNELPIAYYNSNLMLFKFENNFFMNFRLNSFEGLKALKSIATGTTSVAAIYTKDLLKVTLSIPTILEQQKIANFLKGIDNKIDLVNQQLEKTKEFKKGLLQQMFV